ncbi:hypothetical protein ACI2KR_27305 [Pseudomonas luteola]
MMNEDKPSDITLPSGIVVRSEGVSPRGVITLHHIVDPETGKTTKELNMERKHMYPLYSLVELHTPDGYDSVDDGLRLFVQGHDRDCDGTPLYALTFEPETIGKNVRVYKAQTFDERLFCESYQGKVMFGYNESRLKLIQHGDELRQRIIKCLE